jgi:acyl-CoA reductase-like NAD-dependent aldehyde dehydrogenase
MKSPNGGAAAGTGEGGAGSNFARRSGSLQMASISGVSGTPACFKISGTLMLFERMIGFGVSVMIDFASSYTSVVGPLSDETADLDQAAKGIIAGASLDNNIVCIAEKEIIAVESIADELKKRLQKFGGYLLSSHQVRQLEKVVLDPQSDGQGGTKIYPNKNFVGKNASVILDQIGVKVGDDIRIVFCEVDESHPFVQAELLMPVIPLVRVPNVTEAIAMAKRVEHGFGHTACMYSKNIDNLHNMAKVINTSIFVKNAPSYAGLGLGGEGYTSFTIASPTGEGLTNCRTFSRIRRCTLKDHFRIV